MKKRLFRDLVVLQILAILAITCLAGCSNNANDNDTLISKVDNEMSFLDVQLIDMLNELNGISFTNYIVSATEVKESETTSSNSKSESSTKQDSQSGEGEGSSSSDSSDSSSEESGAKDKKSASLDYGMQANGVLLNKQEIDWNNLKYDVEQLYTSWATIILDLYKLNINNDIILAFSAELDTVTKAIKEENKKEALVRIAKLYSYLPKYVESYSKNNKKINVLKTKSNILNAYSIVEDNRQEEVKKELTNAEQAFLPIINNMETSNIQYNINKAYILIKEIQNTLDSSDSDIFYIKYKNLMEELNIIQ